jgi:hypothetical protein
LGYYYGDLSGRGLKGVGVRAIGLAGMIGGYLIGAGEGFSPLGMPLIICGCGVYVFSTLYDMAKIRQAVRERNSRIQKASLNIVPILAPKSRAFGLSLQLGF